MKGRHKSKVREIHTVEFLVGTAGTTCPLATLIPVWPSQFLMIKTNNLGVKAI